MNGMSRMRALVLNLPHTCRIYRCYRCSINSPGFCLPPLELLYAAAVLRESGLQPQFVDAVAEGLPLIKVVEMVRKWAPDLVVSIMGFEHLTEDVDAANAIIEQTGVPHYAVMGYLPTQFPNDMFRHFRGDLILRNEPEQTLRALVGALLEDRPVEGIAGLAVRRNGQVALGPARPRMKASELEALPRPARDLLNMRLYREPFLGTPFASFQAGRGCPFRCIYCTKTYGEGYAIRSPAHVVAEIEDARERFGVRHFRFIDDTFAVSLPWTREFCGRLISTGQQYRWVCLTRIDLMDDERMRLLRRAGCRRLFVGIESGSQKVLDHYRKGYKADDIPKAVNTARRHGIEVVGYFVVGSPVEEESDYLQTADLITRLRLDMVSVYPMTPYPATSSHLNSAEQVDFVLYPYSLTYRNRRVSNVGAKRARDLMKRSYLSPLFLLSRAKWVIRYPAYSVTAVRAIASWLLTGWRRKRKTLL